MNQPTARAWLRLAMSCWLGMSAMAGDVQTDGARSLGKSKDLFELSPAELAQLEITPINVLGSHMHLRGQWMVGYRFMFTDMRGNLDGTRSVSVSDVLQNYPVAHTRMTMEMHMLEVMFAPSDKLTFMAMGDYKHNLMDHQMRTGETFTTRSEGFGDVSLMALYNVFGNVREPGHRLVLNGGVSLPSGSINERFQGRRLEYSMQLGSGTVDLIPGVTYLGQAADWAWGAQALFTVRLGENDNDYRMGDGYRLSAWGNYRVAEWFGPSLRLDWRDWDNVHGADPEFNPATNPAFDAQKQRGRQLDLLMGLNFYVPHGVLKGNRLSIEGGMPVYQSLAGPNLKTDWLITVGWSYTFN